MKQTTLFAALTASSLGGSPLKADTAMKSPPAEGQPKKRVKRETKVVVEKEQRYEKYAAMLQASPFGLVEGVTVVNAMFPQCALFKSIVTAAERVTEKLRLVIEPGRMRVTFMTPCNVMMVEYSLPQRMFRQWDNAESEAFVLAFDTKAVLEKVSKMNAAAPLLLRALVAQGSAATADMCLVGMTNNCAGVMNVQMAMYNVDDSQGAMATDIPMETVVEMEAEDIASIFSGLETDEHNEATLQIDERGILFTGQSQTGYKTLEVEYFFDNEDDNGASTSSLKKYSAEGANEMRFPIKYWNQAMEARVLNKRMELGLFTIRLPAEEEEVGGEGEAGVVATEERVTMQVRYEFGDGGVARFFIPELELARER